MKLTWFGGTTIRLHVGGKILVAGSDGVPAEVVSGADGRFGFDGPALIDASRWRPRKAGTALEERPLEVALHRVGPTSVLVDAVGEPPLVLVVGSVEFGRWADGAVVVLFGDDIVSRGKALLQVARPKIIALASPEGDIDAAFAALPDILDGAVLVTLEPGLALEV